MAIISVMMTARLLVVLLSLGCLCVAENTDQSPRPETKLAVEIPGKEGFLPQYVTAADGVSSLIYDLRRLPASADAGDQHPSALKLEYTVKGDTLTIVATVFYGEFDRQNTPVSLQSLPTEAVGTYSGKLNDTVVLDGLQSVGLEPITVHIVAAQSAFLPSTRSEAPSLQIDYAPGDRTFGTVTIRNLSGKAVNAIQFGSTQATDSGSGSSLGADKGGFCQLIAPNASYQTQMGVPHGGRTVNGVFVEDPQPRFVTLQAVLFADGSYEGDARFAAEMAADELGQAVQQQHIQSLAEPILTADAVGEAPSDAARIQRIRESALALSETPDNNTVATLRAQFPNLSDNDFAQAVVRIGFAMKGAKTVLEHDLQEFERIGSTYNDQVPLQSLWSEMRKCH